MCVSVVMSVYNGEKYLAEAIETVLAQTYAPIEFIVIDDGSTDQTGEILRSYGKRLQTLKQPNRGQPAAQNRGIELATGHYIGFLDADDLYDLEKTAEQVAILEKEREVDIVFGHVEQFISPELGDEAKKQWKCPSGTAPGYLAAAALFRRECFEKVGLLNEDQRIGSFIEWYMRAQELGLKHQLIPQRVFRRRIHENNVGIKTSGTREEYLAIVKAALKRRSHVLL